MHCTPFKECHFDEARGGGRGEGKGGGGQEKSAFEHVRVALKLYRFLGVTHYLFIYKYQGVIYHFEGGGSRGLTGMETKQSLC